MSKNEEYITIINHIMNDEFESLIKYAELIDDFPNGKDHFIHRHWITNAIDCGNLKIVEWMIQNEAPLVFEDDEGYSVLHSAIEREGEDKYQIMQLLIDNGADVNAKGINGWTPAHMAAVRNDLKALMLLKKNDADFTIRTEIDDYATPYQEAVTCRSDAQIISWLKKNS